jgi:hypothetical protein
MPPGRGLEFDGGIVGQNKMDVKKKFSYSRACRRSHKVSRLTSLAPSLSRLKALAQGVWGLACTRSRVKGRAGGIATYVARTFGVAASRLAAERYKEEKSCFGVRWLDGALISARLVADAPKRFGEGATRRLPIAQARLTVLEERRVKPRLRKAPSSRRTPKYSIYRSEERGNMQRGIMDGW